MSKVKRILAVVLAMAMMMAMSIAASAATTINLKNADGATKNMIQVIGADPTTATGWKFMSEDVAGVYETAFETDDEQEIIVALIKKANPDAEVPSKYASVAAATNEQIDKALSGLNVNGTYSSTVEAPGLYAIKATETGYTYKIMAAYVEFGATTTSEIVAKKSSLTVGKTNNGDAADNAAAIGDTVEYTVTTNFPYIDSLATEKFYKVTDTISGAEYDEDSIIVKLNGVDITLDLKSANKITFTEKTEESNASLNVDLSGYITPDNENAGKTVTVTYSATVTGTEVTNEANHLGTDISGSKPAETKIYTGQITLTKTDASDGTTLEGAGFNVVVVAEDGTEGSDLLTFKKETDGVYVYDPDGTTTTTEVKTDKDGKVVVKGLDVGTYKFNEITAPDGYSINENGATAKLEIEDQATAIFTATTSLTDTKLSALPSTGGIGTTIFTIVGCLIMIAAAAMFFVSRRRAER